MNILFICCNYKETVNVVERGSLDNNKESYFIGECFEKELYNCNLITEGNIFDNFTNRKSDVKCNIDRNDGGVYNDNNSSS